MTTTVEAPAAPTGEASDLPAEAARFVGELSAEAARSSAIAKALKGQARVLAPLARPEIWREPKKLGAALGRLRKKLPAQASTALELLDRADAWVKSAPERARQEVSRNLQRACAERGLELRVVRREAPQEVRIAPVSVVFDFARGRAEIQFARQVIETCAATVDEVLRARERALKQLEQPFDPAHFLRACLRAYRLAVADAGGREGDRVEILEFLPFLAFVLQDDRFAVEPSAKNFRGYGRARFAYDVWRLRRAGQMAVDDMRFNLGVATGTTATQKKRVIYFEDDLGNGEYKLTVFFTRAQGGGP